jgi:hypothetical protein
VSSAAQCCPPGAPLPGDGNATADAPGPFSQDFTITNARILVDMVQTDIAVQNSFTESLAAGRPLQMAISTYSTTMHSVLPAGNPAANANSVVGHHAEPGLQPHQGRLDHVRQRRHARRAEHGEQYVLVLAREAELQYLRPVGHL